MFERIFGRGTTSMNMKARPTNIITQTIVIRSKRGTRRRDISYHPSQNGSNNSKTR